MRWGWLAVVAALLVAKPASAAWLEATSRHFVLYADMSDKALRDKAVALERLDWAMRRFMRVDDHDDTTRNKVAVYWLGNGEFQAFCRCPAVAGQYLPRITGPVAFASRGMVNESDFGQTVLFHEYAHHFLLGSYGIAFPDWFSEGFAEFASTLRLAKDSATIGAAAQHRAYGLFGGAQMSARDLFDPVAAAKERRADGNAFYGRGWLLSHYLLFNPDRLTQFKAYLVATNKGTPSLKAAAEAFGDLNVLNRDVERYLRRSTIPAMTMKYADTPVPEVAIRPLGAGEAALVKMRMASIYGVDSKTSKPLFAKAAPVAARYPDDPVVQGWLAEMAYDAGDDAASLAASDRALARDPRSIQALLYRARVAMRRLQANKDAKAEDWTAARKSILAANRIANDDAEPLWLFWQSFAMEGREPTKSAFAGLYRAQDLLPQDTDVRFTAALARLQAGEGDQARALLRPLAYNPHADADNPAARIVAALDAGKTPHEALAIASEKKGEGAD
jgi:hypothetical protein